MLYLMLQQANCLLLHVAKKNHESSHLGTMESVFPPKCESLRMHYQEMF